MGTGTSDVKCLRNETGIRITAVIKLCLFQQEESVSLVRVVVFFYMFLETGEDLDRIFDVFFLPFINTVDKTQLHTQNGNSRSHKIQQSVFTHNSLSINNLVCYS